MSRIVLGSVHFPAEMFYRFESAEDWKRGRKTGLVGPLHILNKCIHVSLAVGSVLNWLHGQVQHGMFPVSPSLALIFFFLFNM